MTTGTMIVSMTLGNLVMIDVRGLCKFYGVLTVENTLKVFFAVNT